MDHSAYEKAIEGRMAYFIIIGAVVFIVGIISIIYMCRNMRGEKIYFAVLLTLACFAVVGSAVLVGSVVYSSLYDINNQAFVIYEGQFKVDTDVETRSGTCSLYLEDGTKLETDAYLLSAGIHEGRIVYGLKTKIVLDVETDDAENDQQLFPDVENKAEIVMPAKDKTVASKEEQKHDRLLTVS